MCLPHSSWQANSVSIRGTLVYESLVLSTLKGCTGADIQVELTKCFEKAISSSQFQLPKFHSNLSNDL